MGLLRIPPVVSGSRIFNMAAVKPEVIISPVETIVTPLQRLTPFIKSGIRYGPTDFLDPENGGKPFERRCYLV